MPVYLMFLAKSFRQRFAYRANSYLMIISALFRVFIPVSVWHALLGSGSISGVTFEDMVNYVVLTAIVSTLTYSNMGNRLAEKINDGSISIDLLRPVRLKYVFISEQLGENAFRTAFHTVPVCVVALLFLPVGFPSSPLRFNLFLVSLVLGIAIVYIIQYLFGLLAFWLKTAFYVNWFLGAAMELFSGAFVPLWFYPDWLYRIALALPFRFISFEPISIYIGKLTVVQACQVILWQVAWLAALLLAEAFIWRKAQHKITIEGG